MSRWTYKTDFVEVDGNRQKVRQLTAGERIKFAEFSKKSRQQNQEEGFNINDLPLLIASFGCIEPTLSMDELRDAPPPMLDAMVSKIMELTGFDPANDEGEDSAEKKAAAGEDPPAS